MMSQLLSLAAALVIAGICDWLAVTRVAAYYTDFDYRYWPLSRDRQIGLGAMLIAAALVLSLGGTIAVLVASATLISIWAYTGIRDLNVQRRAGYRTPPRYSDTIDC